MVPPDRAWTEEQRRAIDRRDGDLLLDAGAGSGKTSVLVERFVAGVLRDGIDVLAMLTITFTEKAAAELRDRIRARLRELGAGEAARRTEGAFISTIHGFCARLLRANALAAGIDPRFVVLDGDRSDTLSAAAFDDALEQLARDRPETVDLVAAYGAGPLRSTTVAVYGQLRSGGQEHPRLPEPAPGAGEEPATEVGALATAAAEVGAELDAIAEPGTRVLDAIAALDVCRDLLARDEIWPPDLGRARLPRNGGALQTDACARYADALAALRTACAARAARPVRDLIDALLNAYGSHYERHKRAVSGLDFEDLELIAWRLLRDDAELRERYATRFERIMVDEQQDTNAVQMQLIESIARDNLFTVGDAQQSIYGFRHARVELFEQRGERLRRAGARATLETNFRSRPELLAALNLAFAEAMGEGHRPLRPGRAAPDAREEPPVELLLVDKAADWEQEGIASPWRLAEASALADRLAELVAAGSPPGGIVVLMRATTDMRAYERALERRGLPTYVIGGRGYWSHPQVVDMVAYLRALANPRDEEALLAVLASPLVGASIDALVILCAAARESGRDPWWLLREPRGELADLEDADRARAEAFAAWFAAERDRAARGSLESLIEAALTSSGYDLAMLRMEGGVRRLANVRKLMRLAREYEQTYGPDLRGFVDAIERRAAGAGPEARESEAPVEGEGLDAIRLMTIHRAKGLEFPVVAVADLGRAVRPAAELVRVSADGRIGIRLARAGAGGRESALDYAALGEEQREAAEREERRLFYVAMTRARDRLILSGATRFDWLTGEAPWSGGGPVAWIAPAFAPGLGGLVDGGGGEVRRDRVRIAVALKRPGQGGCEVPGSEATSEPAAAPAPPAGGPGPVPRGGLGPVPVAALSYSSLQEYARCGYRFYAERVLALPPVEGIAAGDRSGASRRSAADRGVLLHALLERLDFRRPVPPTPEAVAVAASVAGVAPRPGPAEADELIALIRRFAAADLCARLARATEPRREQRFAFPLGEGRDAPLLVGAIDVLAREPGGRALVVDYKSDRLGGTSPAEVVARAYDTQRLIYALAALRSGASSVEVLHCFLEAPEQTVGESFDRADEHALTERLVDLQRGVRAGRFSVSPAPCVAVCAGCPAEGGLCSWPLEMTRRRSPDTLF